MTIDNLTKFSLKRDDDVGLDTQNVDAIYGEMMLGMGKRIAFFLRAPALRDGNFSELLHRGVLRVNEKK